MGGALSLVLTCRLIGVLNCHRAYVPFGRSKRTLHFCNARFEQLLEILGFLDL